LRPTDLQYNIYSLFPIILALEIYREQNNNQFRGGKEEIEDTTSGNKKPQIEEGQTIQWLNEKGQRSNNDRLHTTQKPKV
jgi:hypothetical protein